MESAGPVCAAGAGAEAGAGFGVASAASCGAAGGGCVATGAAAGGEVGVGDAAAHSHGPRKTRRATTEATTAAAGAQRVRRMGRLRSYDLAIVRSVLYRHGRRSSGNS